MTTFSKTALPASADAVVIGAGIIGLTSAYELARAGLSVVVLEKDRIGRNQSGRNLGFVRQQGRTPAELPLMMAANRRWQGLSAELGADVEWAQGGNVRLTNDPEKAQRYEAWLKLAGDHGLDTRQIERSDLDRILPGIEGSWLYGIYTASDGQADPEATCRGYEAANRRLGVRFIEGCPVLEISTASGRVDGVQTPLGAIRSDSVVLAAGAGSGSLGRPAGVGIPQRVVRQTVALTQPVRQMTTASAWTGELFVRQDVHGRFRVAAESRNDVQLSLAALRDLRAYLPGYLRNRKELRLPIGWRELARSAGRPISVTGGDLPVPTASPADVLYCSDRLRRYFPEISDLFVERAWAGEIDVTPDALPVLDTADALPGLVLATGMSGHGFGISPVIGEIIASLVQGKPTPFDLRPFRLSRFSDGSTLQPSHLL